MAIIFVDIDDTLVRSFGSKRIPMTAVIDQVLRLKEEGATLYLWSSGGADYARSTAEELGITHCFSEFLPKPTVYVDDQPVHQWSLCRHVYPLEAAQVSARS